MSDKINDYEMTVKVYLVKKTSEKTGRSYTCLVYEYPDGYKRIEFSNKEFYRYYKCRANQKDTLAY